MDMEIKFDKKYLEELYYIGKTTDKKYRFQPQIAVKYRKTIDMLGSVVVVEDLFRYNGLRYEALHGNKEGLESVRVNDQYRIEFKTTKVVSETVVTICNIIELSNHYK
jgi:proteic killer suppression protein